MTRSTIEQTVRVEFRYGVHFTREVFSLNNPILRQAISRGDGIPSKMIFVVDEGVATRDRRLLEQIDGYCRRHSVVMNSVTTPLVVPGGEALKNTDQYVHLVRDMIHSYGICRHSFVVAVGGGALLDMAGYAAATSHRGVRLVRLPSTVLAQNDSGVGVKTSVNLFGKKNFLGTFTPPHAVINDFEFLESLSDRDWRSGVAEAVKVALIKESEFFEQLEDVAPALVRRDSAAMEDVIYRCAKLHLKHIAGSDPFETGSSRPLDFGHWAAHKLEQLTRYRLRHGEAVAIGIALDATYSHLTGLLSATAWHRVVNLLAELGFTLYVPELESGRQSEPSSLLQGLTEFREHLGGQLTVMLLEGIGRGVEVHDLDPAAIMRSVQIMRQFCSVPSIHSIANTA
jgi:3-dehydroquinate synthase